MAFVPDVLDMAGSAIRLTFSNQSKACSWINFAVMASAACGARRDTVDRIECLVTTRARQLSLRISGNTRHRTHSLHMHGMKLFAAPLLIGLSRQTSDGNFS